MFELKGQGRGLAVAAILLAISAPANASDDRAVNASQVASQTYANQTSATQVYASIGETTRAPIGWIEFCADNPLECRSGATQPRDIVMSQTAWRDLLKVNRWVNENVKPLTDMDHWGVVEKWSLPTDGYGDCEDYVLMKRKMLIDAGSSVAGRSQCVGLAWRQPPGRCDGECERSLKTASAKDH